MGWIFNKKIPHEAIRKVSIVQEMGLEPTQPAKARGF